MPSWTSGVEDSNYVRENNNNRSTGNNDDVNNLSGAEAGSSTSNGGGGSKDPQDEWNPANDARPILPLAAFYMGDLRDGLPMLNMQAAYLISAKNFDEKQIGVLFFVFGISQFLCMAPAGYFLDYSNRKIDWVVFAGLAASALTVLTAITAEEGGKNMALMILWKVLQGGITAIMPPGFNGITLGIVGSTGFTYQVSRNRMMNHIGTALIVASGSLLAYFLYPSIGVLFVVSPLAAIGMAYNLLRIKPTHVDRDAARGLIIESPTMNEYEQYDDEEEEDEAVAAAALSWQKMEEDEDVDPAKAEHQKAEILQTLSDTCIKEHDSNIQSALPYDFFSGGAVSSFPPPQGLPTSPGTASATSSAYMPPDISNSDLGSPQQLYSDARLLPYAIPENKEDGGLSFQSSDLRQRSKSPYRNWSQQENPNHHVKDGLLRSNLTDDSALAGGKTVQTYDSGPSYNLGYDYHHQDAKNGTAASTPFDSGTSEIPKLPSNQGDGFISRKARTPFAVLREPTLLVFTAVIFFWHMSNSSVLPLVMQSLALENPQAGILLSGLCILIAQAFMSYFAKICGDFSPIWGRKMLMLIGLASLTLRCFLLTGLVSAEEALVDQGGSNLLKALILSTQLLDAIGAGILGCLHILVTNDISGGTGRFSLMLGVTTGAMCLGGTMSGYIGQAIAQDYGYPVAFASLGVMSLVPFLLYALLMPETLPDYARPAQQTFNKRRKRLAALLKKLSEQKKKLVDKAMDKAQTFVKRKKTSKEEPLDPQHQENSSKLPASATTGKEISSRSSSHLELV